MKEYKSFYKDVNTGIEGTLCNYTTRLDTYGCGCSHDCKYCYAKSLLDFRGLWNPADPAVADIEKIRQIPKEHRYIKCYHMGRFQSGQMGLTVNQVLRLRWFESIPAHQSLTASIHSYKHKC